MSQSDDVKTDVLNALYWDLAVPRHRVIVEVENGWVTMSGMVDRPYQLTCAESDARRVPGVTGVTNQIRLAPAQAEQGSLASRAGAIVLRGAVNWLPELKSLEPNYCDDRRWEAASVLEDTEHERHGKGDPRTGL